MTNTVRGLTRRREKFEGEQWGDEGKDEGLDRLQGREEVTVVYILKAEGKLLNYRWERLIREGREKRWKEGKRREGGGEEEEGRKWVKGEQLQDR